MTSKTSGRPLERSTHLQAQVFVAERDKQWSTPCVSRGDYTRDGGDAEQERLRLSGEAKAWTTPQAHDRHGARTPEQLEAARTESGAGHRDLFDDVRKWSTPRSSPNENRQTKPSPSQLAGKHGMNLASEVNNWPSPRVEDGQCAGAHRGEPDSVNSAVKQWGTPRDSDHRDCGDPGSKSHDHDFQREKLCAQVKIIGQQLNPDWEELLMGWPIGWTDPAKPCAGIFPGFPMPQGPEQFDYEPPRTIPKGTMPGRTKRVEMCGNGVVPGQAEEAYYALLAEACA